MILHQTFAAALTLLLFVNMPTHAQQHKPSDRLTKAMDKVKPEQIKADITYLADDKLQGRLPGTAGYQMAVDYVCARLQSLDVLPAGEDESWLQPVKLRRSFTQASQLTFDNGSEKAPQGSGPEYVVYPNPMRQRVNHAAEVVFVGYGISEPGLGYDDYQAVDVKGKTVLIIRGAPDKFSSSVSAHTTNTGTLLKVAAAHGATAVIISTADSTMKALPNIGNGVYSVLDEQGNVAVSRTWYSQQIAYLASLKYTLLQQLFAPVGKDISSTAASLKAGIPQSFTLHTTATLTLTSRYQDIMSYNIVGKIKGSDPVLTKEYVVHSAHLDHLGIGKAVDGDSLYNGAHDNASGVASLLGIASIYQGMKVKPKRSVLIVMVTGEELGELGSGYFAAHPTVPVESMVADINTDMPTIIAPLLSVTALGAEHSSLAAKVDEAAADLGLVVEADPEPKQARFTRSDQYSFVLAGIPALHIKYGSRTADGKNNLNEMVAKWRAKYYHKPQDDINGIFDFEAGRKYAQLNFLIGYLVAQDAARPSWNKGDIFGVQ